MIIMILLGIFAIIGLQLVFLIAIEIMVLTMIGLGGKWKEHAMQQIDRPAYKIETLASYFYFIILFYAYLQNSLAEQHRKWRMTQLKKSSAKQLKGLKTQVKKENQTNYQNENT